ncbi:hypothetical protein CK203_009574 [Vitis vinifera]|uniref:Uncharacterized protein n=1 Tax=Vitis vinifera TaxID=29760 RepID=A0A438JS27_VITVI|nr:hypothetical protein CK203_009574 [Vitis vinifera]
MDNIPNVDDLVIKMVWRKGRLLVAYLELSLGTSRKVVVEVCIQNKSLWKRVIVKKYEEVEGADVQGKVGMEMELGCRKSTGVGRITLVEEPLSIRPRVEG